MITPMATLARLNVHFRSGPYANAAHPFTFLSSLFSSPSRMPAFTHVVTAIEAANHKMVNSASMTTKA
jgi:hypothetical protein